MNQFRAAKGKPGLPEGKGDYVTVVEGEDDNARKVRIDALGIRCMWPGSGTSKDGWWTFEDLASQVEDLMDVAEALPRLNGFQILFEFDHSQGHTKGKVGGLHANSMNVKFGGGQPVPNPSKITPGCLGAEKLLVNFKDQPIPQQWLDVPGARVLPDGHTLAIPSMKLKVGEVQSFVFTAEDLPPFAFPVTKKEDSKEYITSR